MTRPRVVKRVPARGLADVPTLVNAAAGWAAARAGVCGLSLAVVPMPPGGRPVLRVTVAFDVPPIPGGVVQFRKVGRVFVEIDPEAKHGRSPAAWVRGLLSRELTRARRAAAAGPVPGKEV